MKSMRALTILYACQKRSAQILDFVPKLKSQKLTPRHGSNKSLTIGKRFLDRTGQRSNIGTLIRKRAIVELTAIHIFASLMEIHLM